MRVSERASFFAFLSSFLFFGGNQVFGLMRDLLKKAAILAGRPPIWRQTRVKVLKPFVGYLFQVGYEGSQKDKHTTSGVGTYPKCAATFFVSYQNLAVGRGLGTLGEGKRA